MGEPSHKLSPASAGLDSKDAAGLIIAALDRQILFYSHLSESVMPFATMGTSAFINIDTYVYGSMVSTLKSIRLVFQAGHLGDVFTLLRKYHDAIVLNVYTNVFLSKNRMRTNLHVQEVQDWLRGKSKLKHKSFDDMLKYIQNSRELTPLFDLLEVNDSYVETRKRCNDHTHYNAFDILLTNDSAVSVKKRQELVECLLADLKNLFLLHTSMIFYYCDHYMMSSDYLDMLEAGMDLEPEAQYWVAPYVQEVFTEVLEAQRPDVAALIKANTKMQLA